MCLHVIYFWKICSSISFTFLQCFKGKKPCIRFLVSFRYCAYVTDEGGIPLLQELVSDPRTTEPVRCLAKMVLDNIESWWVFWLFFTLTFGVALCFSTFNLSALFLAKYEFQKCVICRRHEKFHEIHTPVYELGDVLVSRILFVVLWTNKTDAIRI